NELSQMKQIKKKYKEAAGEHFCYREMLPCIFRVFYRVECKAVLNSGYNGCCSVRTQAYHMPSKGGSAPGSAGMPYMMDFWNKYTVIEIYNAKDCLHMVQ
uniref:hypothetical protein n=1 Tax=Angelakisella massiliensis TaxID=1871018 RepID=UPI0024B08680